MHPYEQTDELCQAVDELGVRIHTALRDGGLDAEPLVDLACLMKEWGASSPVTRELLERLATELTAADLARLGEALLDEIGFGPTFALEPDLLVPLEEALKVVERDVRAAGITGTLRMIVPDWDVMGMAWVESEGICRGNGIRPGTGPLRAVADATQEVVMEVLWGGRGPSVRCTTRACAPNRKTGLPCGAVQAAGRTPSRRWVNCRPNAVRGLLIRRLAPTPNGLKEEGFLWSAHFADLAGNWMPWPAAPGAIRTCSGSRDRASQPKLSATRPVSLLSGWPCVLHASCNSETGHRWRPWSSV